jgi:hypothetical protein
VSETFTFTRQNKEGTITALDMQAIDVVNDELRKVFVDYKTNLVGGDKPKDFTITIEPFKKGKSYRQIRGLYRLLGKIVPVLKEIDPSTYFDVEKVKVIIKDQFGYFDTYNGIKLYKSCKDATIEDMMGLIKTAEKFGQEMGVEDCFLSSEEELALKEYYK